MGEMSYREGWCAQVKKVHLERKVSGFQSAVLMSGAIQRLSFSENPNSFHPLAFRAFRRQPRFLKSFWIENTSLKLNIALNRILIGRWPYNLGNWGHSGGNVYVAEQGWAPSGSFRTAVGTSVKTALCPMQQGHAGDFFPAPCLLPALTSFCASGSSVPDVGSRIWGLVSPGAFSGCFHELASGTQAEA